MKDTIIQDSVAVVQCVADATMKESVFFDTSNMWMWIALGEFVLIALFVLVFSRKNRVVMSDAQAQVIRDAKAEEIDFGNTIGSAFHATALYDKLKVRCHPDRFSTNPALEKVADALFQEITKNKTNLKRLQELQREAQEKLNINF